MQHFSVTMAELGLGVVYGLRRGMGAARRSRSNLVIYFILFIIYKISGKFNVLFIQDIRMEFVQQQGTHIKIYMCSDRKDAKKLRMAHHTKLFSKYYAKL